MARIADCHSNTIIHRSMYNSTSDDSSSDDDSEHEPSHPGKTNTTTVSRNNNNNPILKKKKKKKKKKAVADEIRFLCSYGGEIMVDKHGYRSYCGGENRLILVERRCSFDEFLHRLSTNIFQGAPGRSFTLKYEIPDHNLDLLITIRTDEELQNMIKEYDHFNSSHHYYFSSNLRLFLFPVEDPDPPITINPATTTTTAASSSATGNL